MTNQLSMGDILQMTPSELEDLPVSSLIALQQEIADSSEYLKKVKLVFEGALENRYKEQMDIAYNAKGEETGKAKFHDDFAVIEVNTPKRIDWNQDQMKLSERIISEEWGENPEEYIQTKRTISESAWKNWPEAIKKVFEPARTEKLGKRTIVLKDNAKKEAA